MTTERLIAATFRLVAGRMITVSVASLIMFMCWSFNSVFAQSYQYSDPTPMFLVNRGPLAGQWHVDWDEACVAAVIDVQQFYSDHRGGYHPQYGSGCYYTYHPYPGTGNPYPTFAQNFTIPRLMCALGPSSSYIASLGLCRRAATYNDSDVCSISNPVDPANGAKRQVETDIEFVVGGSQVTAARVLFTESLVATFSNEFGYGWMVEPWRRSVRFLPNSTSPQVIQLLRGGRTVPLTHVGAGVWRNTPYRGLELRNTPGGWLLVDQAEAVLELYDADGRLVTFQKSTGLSFNLTYSSGLLTSVSSPFGPLFSLSYAQGRVAALTGSDNRQAQYSFDPLNPALLSSVTYPDNRTRSYLYEPERAPLMTIPSEFALTAQFHVAAGLPQSLYTGVPTPLIVIAQRASGRVNRFPVTGIVDELGNRFATYIYDAQGRAISTERAGGVQRYQFSYPTANTQTVVTDPLGIQRTYNFTKVVETLKQSSQSQPAGSGCGPSSSSITYDAQANVASRTDFNNNKICYAYDLSRNLETKRVEGLTGSRRCARPHCLHRPPAPASSAPQWHPDWRLETQDRRTEEAHHHHLQRARCHLRSEHRPGRRQTTRSYLHPHRTSHHR